MAYYLTEKGYDVTILEKNSKVGGLARTCFYGGHPYEFGPHIWFWPGGKEAPINDTIVRLTNDDLYYIERRLFTYVEPDNRKYRYPVHYRDVALMPEREQIERELRENRDQQLKLIESQLPEIGHCKFADYHTVFCSIDIDRLWGEDALPYTGRMMIPLLIPGLAHAFPEGAESLHYSSCEFQTRVTEMKVITRHDSPDTLILIEVPVLPGASNTFPRNTIDYALEHNLFAEKAYPQQSEQAFATYEAYVNRGKKIPNLRYVGRHAEFKYWGMPETVNSAYQKALEFEPV